jgi:thiol-disulfide isomerase/thioredoxin
VFSLNSQFEAYASNSTMDENMMTHEMSNNTMMTHTMMGGDHIDTPLKQLEKGVLPHDVKCEEGYALVFKAHDNLPACVRLSSVQILVMRGWALSQDPMMGMKNTSMSNGPTHSMSSMNHTMTSSTENKFSSMIDESQFQKAPSLVGITGYINTTPDELQQEMKGKVILYDFWTFNCINCIHTLPYVTALDAKYADKGLLIIGIHSPETLFEKDPNNVQNAVEKYGIKYPVVLDNNYNTWNAFGNHYWPRQYLVDPNGYIRYDHIGEGNYDEIEKEVQSLLAERNQNT